MCAWVFGGVYMLLGVCCFVPDPIAGADDGYDTIPDAEPSARNEVERGEKA